MPGGALHTSFGSPMGVKYGCLLSALLPRLIVALSTPNGLIDLFMLHLFKMCCSSVLCRDMNQAHCSTAYCALLLPAVVLCAAERDAWLLSLKWCQSIRLQEKIPELLLKHANNKIKIKLGPLQCDSICN